MNAVVFNASNENENKRKEDEWFDWNAKLRRYRNYKRKRRVR